jgi:hypothetical protein
MKDVLVTVAKKEFKAQFGEKTITLLIDNDEKYFQGVKET